MQNQIQLWPVIQSRAFDGLVVQPEEQRLYYVQGAIRSHTQAADITGILGNFGFEKDDMKGDAHLSGITPLFRTFIATACDTTPALWTYDFLTYDFQTYDFQTSRLPDFKISDIQTVCPKIPAIAAIGH